MFSFFITTSLIFCPQGVGLNFELVDSQYCDIAHLEIVPGHLICAGHARQGEEHQGQQGGDGQRQQLEYPEHSHHLQYVP